MSQSISPAPKTAPIIPSFWTYESDVGEESFKVLPDACADVIIDFQSHTAFLSGVMSSFQLCQLPNKTDLIGIRFKAEDFGVLSEVPLNETKNLRVDLSAIFSASHLNKLNEVNDIELTTDRMAFLARFIDRVCKENIEKQDRLIQSVAQQIRLLKGQVFITDLTQTYNMSIRQLERRFKKHMGLTMKEFANIVRFTTAKEDIRRHSNKSLLAIAFDSGFSDHAHLTHEFNRLTGENPSFFR